MKFINVFKKIITTVTIVFCSTILYYSCLYTKNIPKISKMLRSPYILFIFVVIVLILILIALFKYIDKLTKSKEKLFKYILFSILILGQILILLIYDVVQITDSYYITDQAISLANGIEKTINYNFYDYFVNISNNNTLLLLLTLIIKILNIFSLQNYSLGIAVVNAVFINLSIYFIYKSAKEIKNEKFALKTLVLNILNPINYVFIYWFYTSTFSMLFSSLIIYLSIKIKNNHDNKNKNNIFLIILLCFVTIIGTMLRATTLIPFIAAIFYLFSNIKFEKKLIKSYILNIFLVLTVAMITYKGINYSISKYATDTTKSFPITHFLMIGMNEEGRITNEAVEYTSSFETKEEKEKANLNYIKLKFKEYGLTGYVNHTFKKLPITWEDGMSKFKPRVYQDKNSKSISYWISGEKSEIFAVYCQSFRILTFLFALSALLYYKKNKKEEIFMIILTIFGSIVFYLMWEAKEDYNIQFLSIILLLSTFGIDNFLKQDFNKIKHKNTLLKIIIGLTAFFAIIFYKPLTQTEYTWVENKVLAHNTNILEYEKKVYRDNITIKQEFFVNDSFNNITIRALKRANDNSKYRITLKDSKERKVKDFIVGTENIINGYITLNFDDIKIKKQKYILEIKRSTDKYSKDYTDSIQWGYLNSRMLNAYDGVMYINNQKSTKELFIKVYKKYNDIYMNKKLYLTIVGLTFIVEIGTYFYIVNSSRKEVIKNEKK